MQLRSNSRFTALATTLAIASTLAGCSDDASAAKGAANPLPVTSSLAVPPSADRSASASSRTPCDYMVRSDAEAALGLPLPNTTENISLGTCDYTTLEFYGASLTVGVWDSIKTAATSGTRPPVAIAGVGDEALNLNGASGSLLYVRSGDRGFLLTLNGPQVDGLPDHGLAREKTLALKILPRL